jgi:hypothetical protein
MLMNLIQVLSACIRHKPKSKVIFSKKKVLVVTESHFIEH